MKGHRKWGGVYTPLQRLSQALMDLHPNRSYLGGADLARADADLLRAAADYCDTRARDFRSRAPVSNRNLKAARYYERWRDRALEALDRADPHGPSWSKRRRERTASERAQDAGDALVSLGHLEAHQRDHDTGVCPQCLRRSYMPGGQLVCDACLEAA